MKRIKTSRASCALGLLFGVGAVSCASSPGNVDEEDGPVSTTREGRALAPRCYGKMLQPTPLEVDQPIGLSMTLRVNRTCMTGALLVDRKIRIYARRYEGNTIGPQQLLVD